MHIDSKEPETCGGRDLSTHCSVTLRLTDLLQFVADSTRCYHLLPIMTSKAHVALCFCLWQSYSENLPLSGDHSPQDHLFSVHMFNPSIRLPDTNHPISRARQYVLPSHKNLTDPTHSVCPASGPGTISPPTASQT